MATAKARTHKHFQLDAAKIRRAQRALGVRTETEAIERALDLVISEHDATRLAQQAHVRFVKSGSQITDAYGVLEP